MKAMCMSTRKENERPGQGRSFCKSLTGEGDSEKGENSEGGFGERCVVVPLSIGPGRSKS